MQCALSHLEEQETDAQHVKNPEDMPGHVNFYNPIFCLLMTGLSKILNQLLPINLYCLFFLRRWQSKIRPLLIPWASWPVVNLHHKYALLLVVKKGKPQTSEMNPYARRCFIAPGAGFQHWGNMQISQLKIQFNLSRESNINIGPQRQSQPGVMRRRVSHFIYLGKW